MPEPTCRTCYAQTLSEGERTRFFAEDVTGCIYYCPEHQKAQDDLMARIDWSKVVVAKPRYRPVPTADTEAGA